MRRGTSARFWPCLAALVVLATVAAHAAVIGERPIADGTPASGPRVVWLGHRALLVFYDAQGVLATSSPGTPDVAQTVSPQGHPDVTNSLIDLSLGQDDLYVIWRPWFTQGEHQRKRIILFSASRDRGATFSPPTALSRGGSAFHPPPLVQGGAGRLYLAWADEGTSPPGIYFNRSLDGGRTWLAHEKRVDTPDVAAPAPAGTDSPAAGATASTSPYEPFIAADGLRVWLGWAEAPGAGSDPRHVLKLRSSGDGGGTWSAATSIPVPEARTYNMTLLSTPGGLSLFYFAPRAGIQMIHSADGGGSWGTPQHLGGTLEVGGQRFKTAHNARGTLCLTWEGPNSLRGRKADVFASCSPDHGRSWPAQPTRLDTNEPWLTHSLAPHMAMDEQDNVIVAWQDSRNVRPNIYLNYSRDGGKHWSASDVRLDPEPGRSQSTYPWVASAGNGRFLVTWRTRVTDGPEKSYRLSYTAFTLPGVSAADERFPVLEQTPELLLSSEEKMRRHARLVQRVKDYWQALIDADYGRAFGLMDPFYRAHSNMMAFGAALTRVHYLNYQIVEGSIASRGNIATLKVKAALEAPNLQVQGRTMAIPRHESELFDKWLWLDGDWYRVFEHENSNMLPL